MGIFEPVAWLLVAVCGLVLARSVLVATRCCPLLRRTQRLEAEPARERSSA